MEPLTRSILPDYQKWQELEHEQELVYYATDCGDMSRPHSKYMGDRRIGDWGRRRQRGYNPVYLILIVKAGLYIILGDW